MASESTGAISVTTAEDYTLGLLDLTPAKVVRYAALASRRFDVYRKMLGLQKFRILEVGCGVGGLASTFQERGAEYHGIDIDERVVNAARARGVAVVEHRDLLDVEDATGFDVICSSQVLEHITEPIVFVNKVCSLLRPGGIIHFDVPNHGTLAGWPSRLFPIIGQRYGAVTYPHHPIAYTPRALRELLENKFLVNIFFAEPDDPTWGQVFPIGLTTKFYYLASRILHASSILVALGKVR